MIKLRNEVISITLAYTQQKVLKKKEKKKGELHFYTQVYTTADRNYQDDDENDGNYDEDPTCTEGNYQLMQKQHDPEKMISENSKVEKIPLAINATKRDISSN
ncbi:hypothetical protein GQX74_005702 [Glossina fuscipes]|nr:hypothetical protein GQX74_005702 [Glossina fuscipes]